MMSIRRRPACFGDQVLELRLLGMLAATAWLRHLALMPSTSSQAGSLRLETTTLAPVPHCSQIRPADAWLPRDRPPCL